MQISTLPAIYNLRASSDAIIVWSKIIGDVATCSVQYVLFTNYVILCVVIHLTHDCSSFIHTDNNETSTSSCSFNIFLSNKIILFLIIYACIYAIVCQINDMLR